MRRQKRYSRQHSSKHTDTFRGTPLPLTGNVKYIVLQWKRDESFHKMLDTVISTRGSPQSEVQLVGGVCMVEAGHVYVQAILLTNAR